MKSEKRKSFFLKKLVNYEYWPFWVFYIPMYFYGLYLALKSRSFMYFSTTNPGMKYSGVVGESKFKILSAIPEKYIPKTVFIESSTPYSSIVQIINKQKIKYPFIIKPDVGERGKDVEKIDTETELKSYLAGKHVALNIQAYIDLDLEFGVLYHRLPGEKQGSVTSVVQKGFLFTIGDGEQSLRELILKEIRASNRIEYFEQKLKDKLNSIVPKGEKVFLEPIGNHCRGTTFINANHIINDELVKIFNEISLQIAGFYYGRFDLKVPDLEDLYQGENIQIIELNGVSSEVAHVYDPDYKLIQAYKDVAMHMHFIYQIAKKNHAEGIPYDSLWNFLRDLRQHLM